MLIFVDGGVPLVGPTAVSRFLGRLLELRQMDRKSDLRIEKRKTEILLKLPPNVVRQKTHAAVYSWIKEAKPPEIRQNLKGLSFTKISYTPTDRKQYVLLLPAYFCFCVVGRPPSIRVTPYFNDDEPQLKIENILIPGQMGAFLKQPAAGLQCYICTIIRLLHVHSSFVPVDVHLMCGKYASVFIFYYYNFLLAMCPPSQNVTTSSSLS
jgi:hypothetical protein